MRTKIRHTGFTIVELLIVIVVLGILAAITITAYAGVQARARDSARKHDVNEIVKALSVYALDNGPMYIGSGCGSAGNGSGWFNYEFPGTYDVSINNCLINANVTTTTFIDPSKLKSCAGLTCRAYMKYSCVQSGVTETYVFANLETVGHTATDTDTTCAVNADTGQGMNYFIKL